MATCVSQPEERYALYHAYDLMAMLWPSEESWREDRDRNFRHVADIEAPLHLVFRLTNQYDERSWLCNREVVWHATDAPIRSTSVGDVIQSYETGQAWLVMPSHLKEIAPLSEGAAPGSTEEAPQ